MDLMRILVTGSTGGIGREFVKQATAAGHELTCPGREWAGKLFLGGLVSHLHSFDVVVHLAAAGVRRSQREWKECVDVNFHALRSLLGAIAISGATPFVFLARSQREGELPHDPSLWSDPYYVSKFIGGTFAETWQHHYAGRVSMPLLPPCFDAAERASAAARILRDITEK